MKLFAVCLLTCSLFALSVSGQDFDVYLRQNNSDFDMPAIDTAMSLQEFELLSRQVRMKDMAYALVVPGYVHFKTYESRMGYYLLGARLTGYAGLGILALDSDYKLRHFLRVDYTAGSAESTQKTQIYQAVSIAAGVLIMGSYFYDVIAGDWALSRKKEHIRYHYSLQMQAFSLPGQGAYAPGLSLQWRF